MLQMLAGALQELVMSTRTPATSSVHDIYRYIIFNMIDCIRCYFFYQMLKVLYQRETNILTFDLVKKLMWLLITCPCIYYDNMICTNSNLQVSNIISFCLYSILFSILDPNSSASLSQWLGVDFPWIWTPVTGHIGITLTLAPWALARS